MHRCKNHLYTNRAFRNTSAHSKHRHPALPKNDQRQRCFTFNHSHTVKFGGAYHHRCRESDHQVAFWGTVRVAWHCGLWAHKGHPGPCAGGRACGTPEARLGPRLNAWSLQRMVRGPRAHFCVFYWFCMQLVGVAGCHSSQSSR